MPEYKPSFTLTINSKEIAVSKEIDASLAILFDCAAMSPDKVTLQNNVAKIKEVLANRKPADKLEITKVETQDSLPFVVSDLLANCELANQHAEFTSALLKNAKSISIDYATEKSKKGRKAITPAAL